MADSSQSAAVRKAIHRDEELSSGRVRGRSHGQVMQTARRALRETAEAKKEYYQGDAFELIARTPDASVDLIITSPPYWGQRSYGLSHNWDILKEWKPKNG